MGTLSDRAERMIEGEDWRTTRREAPKGGFEQRQTVARWGAILSAVVAYQNKYHGLSPSNGAIARDTGLSVGQVQYHLKEMEAAGLVKDNTDYPRQLTVVAAKIQDAIMRPLPTTKPTEAKVMDTKDHQRKRGQTQRTGDDRKKRESKFDVAVRTAKLIDQHWREIGRAPHGLWLREQLGYHASGGFSQVANHMVAMGWISHDKSHQRDYALTGLGRSVLLNERQEQTPAPPPPPEKREALEHVASVEAPVAPVEARQSVSSLDRELDAMRTIDTVLGPLTEPQRKRILNYVCEALGSRVSVI